MYSFVEVLSGAVIAQNSPRITVANEDAHIPSGESAATLPPGSDAMQQLLNWAIEHSDPEKVKEMVAKYMRIQHKPHCIQDARLCWLYAMVDSSQGCLFAHKGK